MYDVFYMGYGRGQWSFDLAIRYRMANTERKEKDMVDSRLVTLTVQRELQIKGFSGHGGMEMVPVVKPAAKPRQNPSRW